MQTAVNDRLVPANVVNGGKGDVFLHKIYTKHVVLMMKKTVQRNSLCRSKSHWPRPLVPYWLKGQKDEP